MLARTWLWAMTLGGLIFLLTACDEGSVPSKAPPPAQKARPAPAKPDTAPPETVEETEGEGIVYSPAELRDPFTPLALVRQPVVQDVPLTPIQQFELDQFRLVGLLVGKGEPRAMVAAPDGKTYILKKGTRIGKNYGEVVAINSEGILVRERYYDFSGEVLESDKKIELPKREGEQ